MKNRDLAKEEVLKWTQKCNFYYFENLFLKLLNNLVSKELSRSTV